ncbi:MAG: hypothetical protein M1383_06270 [Patescibacteria group bacterium]|nr:hypothetical protein [Patescibacteria group bacterium]
MVIPEGAVKIFELSAADFLKGISYQRFAAIGGLFQILNDTDPFEVLGYLIPSLTPTRRGDATVLTTPLYSTEVNDAGTSYIYLHDASKLYQVNTLSGAVTDITASSGITTGSAKGAITWKGKYIYALNGSVVANTIGTNTNTTLLTGLNTNDHVFCIGPDGNLYVTDGNAVHILTSATGTTGNSLNAVVMETGMTIRDLLNDGQYLVLIADASGTATYGRYRCVVAFWDLAKASFDILWDYWETKFIGGEILDDDIIVFGQDNMYRCGRGYKLRKFFTFRGNSTITVRPNGPQSIIKVGGSIYWGGASSSRIYAYGTQIEGGKRIFYQPYSVGAGNISCLGFNGSSVFAACDQPALYQMNAGATRGNCDAYTTIIQLKRAYKMAFAKAVFRDRMSANQSIALQVIESDGAATISLSDTKAYANVGALKRTTFYPYGNRTTEDFESFYVELTLGKLALERFELWAVPLGLTGTQQ